MEPTKIYCIGICGIAMGTLASMLHKRGYTIAGSDANIYPPMSDILAKSEIKVYQGFHERNIGSADLVVVGNAISRGNPELEYVLDNGIPYISMAGALYRFFLHDREVVAIAGTHGKSTTAALLSHIMASAGEDPSFFIGAVLKNYDSNFGLGKGRFFVIEGDEYDSAYFEKVPKFIFYRPTHLVLTSLEFDHADIYRDLSEIELWFRRLVNMLPSRGHIVYSNHYTNIKEIAAHSLSRKTSFGKEQADFTWSFIDYVDSGALIKVACNEWSASVCSRLTGDYNFMNIAAAAAMASRLGVDKDRITRGIETFQGVRRRMELIYERGNVKVFEDFAHHPTAIGGVLRHLKEQYKGYDLWAIYEPRSATSRRNVFSEILPMAFKDADRIMLREPYKLESIKPTERIDIQSVRSEINRLKGNAKAASVFENADAIVSAVAREIDGAKKNIIVIMSNGGFEGIYEKLQSALDGLLN